MVAQNISLDTPLKAAENQVAAELGTDVVLLDLNAGLYHGLNATGGRIWKLLQNTRTGSEICDVILKEYEVEATRCQRDVLSVLQDLAAKGLVKRA